jgi:transcription antitermination factor NusG
MMGGISYHGPLWHVAYTAPRAERRALDGIADLGLEGYAPFEKLRPKVAGAAAIERPLFARYVLFSRDPHQQDWQPVLDLDGISDVLMTSDDVPGYVPVSWVHAIRKAEGLGMFDRTTTQPDKFKVGETVRVSDGPFAGHNALITEFIAKLRSATASKRAKVLVSFMGRMSALELPITSLETL